MRKLILLSFFSLLWAEFLTFNLSYGIANGTINDTNTSNVGSAKFGIGWYKEPYLFEVVPLEVYNFKDSSSNNGVDLSMISFNIKKFYTSSRDVSSFLGIGVSSNVVEGKDYNISATSSIGVRFYGGGNFNLSREWKLNFEVDFSLVNNKYLSYLLNFYFGMSYFWEIE